MRNGKYINLSCKHLLFEMWKQNVIAPFDPFRLVKYFVISMIQMILPILFDLYVMNGSIYHQGYHIGAYAISFLPIFMLYATNLIIFNTLGDIMIMKMKCLQMLLSMIDNKTRHIYTFKQEFP